VWFVSDMLHKSVQLLVTGQFMECTDDLFDVHVPFLRRVAMYTPFRNMLYTRYSSQSVNHNVLHNVHAPCLKILIHTSGCVVYKYEAKWDDSHYKSAHE